MVVVVVVVVEWTGWSQISTQQAGGKGSEEKVEEIRMVLPMWSDDSCWWVVDGKWPGG